MSQPQNAPIPPQNLDAEESVLGAMLLGGGAGAVDRVLEVNLSAADFYRESHGHIYRAILSLYAKGEPVDAITVAQELELTGTLKDVEGGAERVHELAALVPAASNAAHYARIVSDMALYRGLIRLGNDLARFGYDRLETPPVYLEQAEEMLFDLTRKRRTSAFVGAEEAVRREYDRIVELYHGGGRDIVGLATGFVDLDKMTSGIQPGNLAVLAARPSMGKSALALGICANVAIRQQIPVALFTIEMSIPEVTQRLISMEARVESPKLRTGRLNLEEWAAVSRAAGLVAGAPLYMEQDIHTLSELRGKARQIALEQPTLGLIVIDYLQLMTANDGQAESRVQDVSQISRGLKVLARELNVPILALSQLSRAPESRHDKRPMLSDLRESGSIEQDGDLVAFIYRDEYYFPDELENQGIAEVNIAKQRNGPVGMRKLAFTSRYALFADLAHET